MKFLDALLDRPLAADGAMGTVINSRGVGFERSFEGLNLSDPDLILGIHREFAAAGADILETNTFSATPIHLDRWGLADKCHDINTAAVRLARQAGTESGRNVFVAGSIGPTGLRLAPLGPLSNDDAQRAFVEQVTALADAGVDLLAFETFADITELEAAIAAARTVCALPILASMSFSREARTVADVVPETAIERLTALRVDVIGANCSTGPRGVFEVLSRYAEHESPTTPRIPFSAMPNAGYPESRGERLHFPAPPDYFTDYARRFLDVGARIVGGCCGTTAEHIVGVRRALDNFAPAPTRLNRITRTVERVPAAPSAPADDRPPALAAALQAGRFITTVEVEPPKSPDTRQLEATAVMLRDAGVTTLNISDTPMARMRMTGLAAAVKVQQATGLETVLHFPVRGRNLLRVQGDLLAAHALDVRTLFVTMGDLASIGDYPQAFDNHDIVPTGLVRLVTRHFNVGVDSAGSSIGRACSFFAGVALNLTPSDLDAEAKLLHRKISFGANFALTQPVFDSARARVFLARYADTYGPMTLPLLVGMLPLASGRHAVFLKNEVPGMSVPDVIVSRMEAAGEHGRVEGRRIAAELLAEVRDFASGVYFIPAFKRFEIVADLVAEVTVEVTGSALIHGTSGRMPAR